MSRNFYGLLDALYLIIRPMYDVSAWPENIERVVQ
jgi:hypothetical protein